MRIRCPSCSATYEVPDSLLAHPRTVRCAKCSHDWMAVPVPDDDALEVDAEEPTAAPAPGDIPTHPETALGRGLNDQHEVEDDDHLEPEQVSGSRPMSAIEQLSAATRMSPQIRRHDRILTAAWAASFAVLAALGVAGYTKRETLMREWPASKRVYATLGLAPVDNNTRDGDAPNGTSSR